ncbi:MAG: hypothetical protein M3R14_07200 [Acidobacteriota bacterium]|nr:hypothetical protein [Acidobacteriota bacterium]
MRKDLRFSVRLAEDNFSGRRFVLKLIAELAKIFILCLIVFAVMLFILTDPLGIAAPHSDTLPRQTMQSTAQ